MTSIWQELSGKHSIYKILQQALIFVFCGRNTPLSQGPGGLKPGNATLVQLCSTPKCSCVFTTPLSTTPSAGQQVWILLQTTVTHGPRFVLQARPGVYQTAVEMSETVTCSCWRIQDPLRAHHLVNSQSVRFYMIMGFHCCHGHRSQPAEWCVSMEAAVTRQGCWVRMQKSLHYTDLSIPPLLCVKIKTVISNINKTMTFFILTRHRSKYARRCAANPERTNLCALKCVALRCFSHCNLTHNLLYVITGRCPGRRRCGLSIKHKRRDRVSHIPLVFLL